MCVRGWAYSRVELNLDSPTPSYLRSSIWRRCSLQPLSGLPQGEARRGACVPPWGWGGCCCPAQPSLPLRPFPPPPPFPQTPPVAALPLRRSHAEPREARREHRPWIGAAAASRLSEALEWRDPAWAGRGGSSTQGCPEQAAGSTHPAQHLGCSDIGWTLPRRTFHGTLSILPLGLPALLLGYSTSRAALPIAVLCHPLPVHLQPPPLRWR